jgi:hypothetical protein
MYELQRETAGIQNKCDNLTFETAPHQLFLKNFMNKESPYKGLLLFHGVGVGKTCSAITIAESFRDVFSRKDKRSIILSSKNIQIGWKKTIFNPGLKEEQCTGKVFLNRNIKTKRELTRLVKEYYELMAYQSFGNFVKRLIQSSKMKYPSYSQEELERTVIQDYFSGNDLCILAGSNLTSSGLVLQFSGRQASISKILNAIRNKMPVERITRAKNSKGISDVATTLQQHRIIKVAHNNGWYSVPKKTSIRDIAAKLGLSKSTVAEQLVKAEGEIVSEFLKKSQ